MCSHSFTFPSTTVKAQHQTVLKFLQINWSSNDVPHWSNRSPSRCAFSSSSWRCARRGAWNELNWSSSFVSETDEKNAAFFIDRFTDHRCFVSDTLWTGIWIWTESFFNHSSLWFILLFIKFKYVKLTLNRLRNNDAICWVFTNFNDRSFDPSFPHPQIHTHFDWYSKQLPPRYY